MVDKKKIAIVNMFNVSNNERKIQTLKLALLL